MKILNYEASKAITKKFKVEYNDTRYDYTEWLDENGQIIDYQIVDQYGLIPNNYDELIELIGFHLDEFGY